MPLFFFKCCSNDFSYLKENSEYGTILREKRTEKSTELYLDLGEKALSSLRRFRSIDSKIIVYLWSYSKGKHFTFLMRTNRCFQLLVGNGTLLRRSARSYQRLKLRSSLYILCCFSFPIHSVILLANSLVPGIIS